MANPQNLIPNSQRTPTELREMTRKGGIKSGEVRRARRSFKESFVNELSEGKTQEDIVRMVIEKARQGDIKCVEFIRDTIGEKPTEKVENSGTQTLDISIKVME